MLFDQVSHQDTVDLSRPGLETVFQRESSDYTQFPIRIDLDLQYPGKLLRKYVSLDFVPNNVILFMKGDFYYYYNYYY